MRASPKNITSLEPNQIFVFGSNQHGHHAGGAAKYALENFGAEWGKGVGMQGQSYAINTMESLFRTRIAVYAFLIYAESRPDLEFLVTEIGCGIAGYTVAEIAPFFAECPDNVLLPESFINHIKSIQSCPTN